MKTVIMHSIFHPFIQFKINKFRLKTCLAISSFLFLVVSVNGQRFSTKAIIGLNAAQIEGDLHSGFNKLGLTAGLHTEYALQTNQSLAVELLYSQRGSTPELVQGNAGIRQTIQLNYIEIPILYQYHFLENKEWNYYRLIVNGGLSYGRLIKASASQGSNYASEVEGFKKNDLSFIFGVDYATGENFSFGARFTQSILRLYKEPDVSSNLDSLIGYFLTFRISYTI